MDLQELAQNIKAIRDEAKHRWGEQKTPRYELHYIPARGYPGESIPREEIKDSSVDENWNCTRCGKTFKQCLNQGCNLLEKGNFGWEYHIIKMFLSDDPETYLLEHPGGEK